MYAYAFYYYNVIAIRHFGMKHKKFTIINLIIYFYMKIIHTIICISFFAYAVNGSKAVPYTLNTVTIFNGEEMPENYLNNFTNVKTLSLPNELKLVDQHATQDMKALEEVIYSGTEEEWNEIDIKEQNDPLLKKIITFAPVEEAEWVTGDANGDGELDMSDIVLIMQALANPDKFGVDGYDPTHITANGFKYADTNGDGLTVSDAANIQKFLLGLSDSVSA